MQFFYWQEADVTISFGPVSYPKFLSFDTTVGMITDNIVMMIPYPEQGIDASGLISNFCPVVSETKKINSIGCLLLGLHSIIKFF